MGLKLADGVRARVTDLMRLAEWVLTIYTVPSALLVMLLEPI